MSPRRMHLIATALMATAMAPTMLTQTLAGQRATLTDAQVQSAIDAGTAGPSGVSAIRRDSEPSGLSIEVLTPQGRIQELAAARAAAGSSMRVAEVAPANRAPTLWIRVRPAGPNRETLTEPSVVSSVPPEVTLVGTNGDIVRAVNAILKVAMATVKEPPVRFTEIIACFDLDAIDRLFAAGDSLEVVVQPDHLPRTERRFAIARAELERLP